MKRNNKKTKPEPKIELESKKDVQPIVIHINSLVDKLEIKTTQSVSEIKQLLTDTIQEAVYAVKYSGK